MKQLEDRPLARFNGLIQIGLRLQQVRVISPFPFRSSSVARDRATSPFSCSILPSISS
jgi:hypothetical protein